MCNNILLFPVQHFNHAVFFFLKPAGQFDFIVVINGEHVIIEQPVMSSAKRQTISGIIGSVLLPWDDMSTFNQRFIVLGDNLIRYKTQVSS